MNGRLAMPRQERGIRSMLIGKPALVLTVSAIAVVSVVSFVKPAAAGVLAMPGPGGLIGIGAVAVGVVGAIILARRRNK